MTDPPPSSDPDVSSGSGLSTGSVPRKHSEEGSQLLGSSLPRLAQVMEQLLSEDGCPWDRAQTLETLTPYVVEEAHEVVDAIEKGDPSLLREELGDLLLQVVFQSQLCREQGWFDLDGVIAGIVDKLVRRHPHVFARGDGVEDRDAAYQSWEAIKQAEKKDRGALDGVPTALPALLRAYRVGEKAQAAGLDWPDADGPRAKIDEELHEIDEAAASGDREALCREVGDLLFSVVNFCRHRDIDPEAALRGTVGRFSARFSYVERAARADGRSIKELPVERRDALFEASKSAVIELEDASKASGSERG